MWNEGDIEGMLQGLGGVPVVHGAEHGFGLLDAFDETMLQGMDTALIGHVVALTVATASFPTLKMKGAITIAEDFITPVSYTVNSRFAIDDGALTKLLCLKA